MHKRSAVLTCSCALLWCYTSFAQAPPTCPALPFIPIKQYTGSVSIVGHESGVESGGESVTMNVTTTGSPVLNKNSQQCSDSLSCIGFGGNFNGHTDYNEVDTDPSPNGSSFSVTYNGITTTDPISLTPATAQISFDGDACTYSVAMLCAVPAVLHGKFGDSPSEALCGPPLGEAPTLPAKPTLGTGIVNIPVPAKSTLLQGSRSFTTTDGTVPTQWTVNWNLAPKGVCQVTIPKYFKQGASPWGPQQYDHDALGQTIGRWGCAMTSMTMAMEYAGYEAIAAAISTAPNPVNPGTVNSFMTQSPGDFAGRGVVWDAAVRDLSGGVLKFDSLGGSRSSEVDRNTAETVLTDALCAADPHPVIVGVKMSTDDDGNRVPGHFVLVTGTDGQDFDIADPATGQPGKLSSYGAFQTRGIVKDPPGDISQLDIGIDNNATVAVIDSAGRVSGTDPISRSILQDIPQSAAWADRITDDIDGSGAPETNYSVQIFQPQGSFIIVIAGISAGPYTLAVRAFNPNGSKQPALIVQGTATKGSSFSYQVDFLATDSTIVSIPGDRNGDGKVDCADLAIVKNSFGRRVGQAAFDPRADVNGDGVVDIRDLSTVAKGVPQGTACH